jgi:glycosyltransferase involved in cell wall biosynthesis
MVKKVAPLRVMHMVGAAKPGGAEMFAYRLLVALHGQKDIDLLVVVRQGSWLERVLGEAGVPIQSVPFGGMFVPRPHYRNEWATVARLGGFYDLKYYRGKVVNLIGNTQAICDYCVEHGWNAARVRMISNFIPEPQDGWRGQRDEVRRELKIAKDACVLMMAGRLHKVKGVDVALQALAGLPETFVLLLVGEGPLRSELTLLAERLGVSDRVKWVGWRDSVTPFAAAADIWLAPSRHEPLGNTALDGFVHGVPVIASNTGGLAMLIENGKNGVLVEPEDADGLRKAIVKVAGDKKLRAKLVEGGLTRFRKDYSEDGIVGKYVAYYKELGMKG